MSQIVTVNGKRNLKFVVLQGSVVGPTLFKCKQFIFIGLPGRVPRIPCLCSHSFRDRYMILFVTKRLSKPKEYKQMVRLYIDSKYRKKNRTYLLAARRLIFLISTLICTWIEKIDP